MAPPTFADLGKSARDLFNKGYTHGFLKFDSTTKSSANGKVEFKTGASHNLTTQKLAGNLELKYDVPEYGTTITEKWNTDNLLGTVIEVKDQFARGLKLTLDTSYTPHTAKRDAVIKSEWTNDNAKVNASVTLFGGPIVNLSGVLLLKQDWLAGVQTKFDVSTSELKGTSFAFGRQTRDYTIHTFTNDGREFGASVFHVVHKNVELGAQLGWNVGDQNVRFGLASKYRLNSNTILRGKVDNKSAVAVAATHDLSPDLKLTFSTQFDLLQAQPTNNQKFGVGLEYNPA
jgi:hypothetical protein